MHGVSNRVAGVSPLPLRKFSAPWLAINGCPLAATITSGAPDPWGAGVRARLSGSTEVRVPRCLWHCDRGVIDSWCVVRRRNDKYSVEGGPDARPQPTSTLHQRWFRARETSGRGTACSGNQTNDTRRVCHVRKPYHAFLSQLLQWVLHSLRFRFRAHSNRRCATWSARPNGPGPRSARNSQRAGSGGPAAIY